MKTLLWTSDSLTLCTIGADGAIYEYSVATWGKTAEQVTRDAVYACAAYDGEHHIVRLRFPSPTPN